MSDLVHVGGSKAHCLLQYFSSSLNSKHWKIFLQDFCFNMKLTSCSTCTARGPRPPQFIFNNLFNEHIPKLFFLKYFVLKNWRGGVESLLKNGTIDGYAY